MESINDSLSCNERLSFPLRPVHPSPDQGNPFLNGLFFLEEDYSIGDLFEEVQALE